MNKSGLNDFLLEVIHNEKVASVLAITTKDLSSFAELCEDYLQSHSRGYVEFKRQGSALHCWYGAQLGNKTSTPSAAINALPFIPLRYKPLYQSPLTVQAYYKRTSSRGACKS